jgi:hypothetical protein
MMRRLALAGLLAGLAGGPAMTQDNSVVVVPPAPPIASAPAAPAPIVQTPSATPPPGLVQTTMPPVTPDNTAPAVNADTGAATAVPAPPDAAPPPPPWAMGKVATLGVLDKVDGGTSQVTIPVGGQAAVGDLQVNVLACATRPAGQIPDTAIYLSAQANGAAGAPLYHGWMLRSAPGAAVVGDASETFRVINCS